MPMRKLTPEDVRWCYRLLLGREPESLDVITGALSQHEFVLTFVDTILSSEEFREQRRSRGL